MFTDRELEIIQSSIGYMESNLKEMSAGTHTVAELIRLRHKIKKIRAGLIREIEI